MRYACTGLSRIRASTPCGMTPVSRGLLPDDTRHTGVRFPVGIAGVPFGTGTRNSCRSGFRTSSFSSFLDSGWVGGSQSMSNAPAITAMTVHSIVSSLDKFELWLTMRIRLVDNRKQYRYLVELHLVGGFERVKVMELSLLFLFRYCYHHVTIFENHGAHDCLLVHSTSY